MFFDGAFHSTHQSGGRIVIGEVLSS